MRIALLGGSFNPPHVGHLMNAYYVLATRPVDRVWLMPVYRHPFAKTLASFEDRVNMCELAAARFGGAIEVSRVEQDVPGSGRTIETIEYLLAKYPEHQFSLVIGTDILPERSQWKNFDRIEQLVQVTVIQRAGFHSPLALGPALPEISSTEIRDRILSGGDISHLVPREVVRYIEEHRLYRDQGSGHKASGHEIKHIAKPPVR